MLLSITVILLSTHFSILSGFKRHMCPSRLIPSPSELKMLDVLSIAAGSIAGAVGVGFAYPLDSMKTKIQNIAASTPESEGAASVQNSLLAAQCILKDEGFSSLYKGVVGVMLGNALIKACAFSANRWALSEIAIDNPTLNQLILAAAFSGLVTSFFSNPIERVKVLMQSNINSKAKGSGNDENVSEIQIILQVIQADGLYGLAFRGIDATIAREIPGYSLYFASYFFLMHSSLGADLGSIGPVVMGAFAGMLSWLIVFPLDVCKTNLQNILSAAYPNDSKSCQSQTGKPNLISTAKMLRKRHGMGIFVRGIAPKMLQAGVNHSITFYVYDLILNMFAA